MLLTLGLALHSLLIALTAFFITCCLIPWLHEPLRSVIRPAAVHHVEAGLAWVAAAQHLQRPWLTKLFQQSSAVVSVGFYATVLPGLHFIGLPELVWHLVSLMTLTLYVGNCMKDLVCAPRPLNVSYGKEKLKFLGGTSEEAEKNAKEYGLPSSHTMNSISLNFYLIWYLHHNGLVATRTAGVLYLAAALWVVWVAASRLYLGLHTPIDLIAGAVAGASVLSCFIAIQGVLSWWVTHSPWSPLEHALASLVLLRLYPRPISYTPSFEFSTSFFGAMFGSTAGLARSHKHFHSPPIQLEVVWAQGLPRVLRRVVLGLLVVVAAKEASRALFLLALPPLYRFFPFQIRRLWQPPVHNQCPPSRIPDPKMRALPHNAAGKPWDVDVTSRFFAYAGIGFAVFEIVPYLFAVLGW